MSAACVEACGGDDNGPEPSDGGADATADRVADAPHDTAIDTSAADGADSSSRADAGDSASGVDAADGGSAVDAAIDARDASAGDASDAAVDARDASDASTVDASDASTVDAADSAPPVDAGCTSDQQCAGLTVGPCETPVCVIGTGACAPAPKADTTPCDDGNACTQTDTCQSGVCTGGNPVTCVASDQCHAAGTCDTASGTCSNPALADTTPCDDGNACTQTDTCTAGVCLGANPVTCVASDQCHTAGTCDTASGACSNPALPDLTPCNDGDLCTQVDTCSSGICMGASPVTCTASDACHVAGACDPGTGICSNPVAPSCNGATGVWLFNEGAGLTANDSSGNANVGTLATPAWASGASCHEGACLVFNGTSDRVTVPYSASLQFGTGDFTVAAWVNTTAGGGENIIVGANRCAIGESWLLSVVNSKAAFATFGTGSSGGYLFSSAAVDDGTWHLVAGRRTGTLQELLVDGVVVASATISASYNSNAGGAFLTIGNLFGCTGRELGGSIDDVRIFGRALSDAEIQGL